MFRLIVFLLLLLPPAAAAQEPREIATRIVESARGQIGVTVRYDPDYTAIPFPGGDVPMERGVCTDVIVRAYRSIGVDLQLLVHQDMKKNFSAYPRNWSLSRPDPNIDHRRVLNLAVFFTRHGEKLPITREPNDYAPGDIVTWRLPRNLPHIGLVSDRKNGGYPMIIHNIGEGAQIEDILFAFEITGHYRHLPKPK